MYRKHVVPGLIHSLMKVVVLGVAFFVVSHVTSQW